jgi:hypothetical protein
MTQDDIIGIAAKRIVEAERQRDKARRELSRARKVIRDLVREFTADYEVEEGEYDGDRYVGPSSKSKAYDRALRFLEKGKRK